MADITNYDMLINGQWVQASDGATFSSVDPATGAIWATIPAATGQDVDHALEAASAALNGPWGRMTPSERGKCLGRLADLLSDHSEQIGRIETKDTGTMLKET